MKKLKLFISLWFTMFSVAVFAQAEFEKIAITQNTQDNLAGRLLVQDVTTGEIRYILKSVLDNKFNQPTGNATQYLDGAGNPTTFPVLGQSDRVITEVRNTTGATVTKGTVVYLTGASGGKPTIQKAQANAESTSSGTFGVIQSDINNNSNGYVVVIGTVLGVNTSSYSEGQILWLSPTTAGGFTTTKPVAPNHAVYVAIVTLASTQGAIEVKIQNGYELDELHDVAISSKTNKDFLTYESSSDLWKNKSLGTIIGGTSSQFIKGNGSLDSNTYALDSVVVKLTGNQSISGKKSFNLVQTGYNLSLITSDIFSDGFIESNNGMLRLVNNTTSADLFRLESDGIVFAKAFKKDGGTSSEFLMADGSVSTGGGLSGTTNYIPKFTSSSSIGNSLIYDNGTTVGIANGTSSTIGRLFVKGIEAQPNNTITISTPDFVQSSVGSVLTIGHNASSGDTPAVLRNIIEGATTYGNICFPFGNIGIGTVSPTVKLDIEHNGYAVLRVKSTVADQAGLQLTTSHSSPNNNNWSFIAGRDSVRKLSIVDNLGGERLSISTSGAVKVFNLGTGTVYSNAGTLTNTNPSDERLKNEITDLPYGLNEILQLRPVTYLWKNDTMNQGKQFGFIAQEVQEVMPELVKEFKTEEGNRLGLDKEGIYAALVNAIKEQQSQIKELKAEIEILKNK